MMTYFLDRGVDYDVAVPQYLFFNKQVNEPLKQKGFKPPRSSSWKVVSLPPQSTHVISFLAEYYRGKLSHLTFSANGVPSDTSCSGCHFGQSKGEGTRDDEKATPVYKNIV